MRVCVSASSDKAFSFRSTVSDPVLLALRERLRPFGSARLSEADRVGELRGSFERRDVTDAGDDDKVDAREHLAERRTKRRLGFDLVVTAGDDMYRHVDLGGCGADIRDHTLFGPSLLCV